MKLPTASQTVADAQDTAVNDSCWVVVSVPDGTVANDHVAPPSLECTATGPVVGVDPTATQPSASKQDTPWRDLVPDGMVDRVQVMPPSVVTAASPVWPVDENVVPTATQKVPVVHDTDVRPSVNPAGSGWAVHVAPPSVVTAADDRTPLTATHRVALPQDTPVYAPLGDVYRACTAHVLVGPGDNPASATPDNVAERAPAPSTAAAAAVAIRPGPRRRRPLRARSVRLPMWLTGLPQWRPRKMGKGPRLPTEFGSCNARCNPGNDRASSRIL